MEICGIICEFNPFHNGHKYILERAKELSGCDAVVCFMSGSFTQRGEMCILDKYSRARHAVLAGADAVIELPVAFSVAPAEIFAQGAIKLISSLDNVKSLAFGCESGEKIDFISAADILLDETEEFKSVLNDSLICGESYIKSYQKAFESAGGNKDFLSKPNNVLGVEYTKAVKRAGLDIEIIPVRRHGAKYNDEEIKKNFSSAGAIRNNLSSPLLESNVPDFVYGELKDLSVKDRQFKKFLQLILTRTPAETLKNIYGCGEGLENKLKSLENLTYDEIIANACGRRYSAARIKRILCANFLRLYTEDCKQYLQSELYLKPLAVNTSKQNEILSALSQSKFKLIIRGRDKLSLPSVAQKCLASDEFAYSQWKLIYR